MATINVLVRWADNTADLKRNLQQGINQLEATKASVESLARSLGGEKLIQAAHRSVAAIASIGGAAQLTASEAQRQFALIDRAMEKMAITGKTIPDDMRKMRDELEKVAQPADTLAVTFGRVAAAAVAMVAVAIVNWFQDGVRAGLQYGDMLVGLKAKTDLSIRDLQILEDIGIDANVSIEQLARGVQMLQERLANGSANRGIRELGLSVDAIRQMSPGEMFATIGAAIAQIEDPILRAEAASRVFGRAWREIMPALRADMAEAAKNATLVGDAQAEAADRGIDAWNKFWNDQTRGWTNWAGDIILNFEKVRAAQKKLEEFGAVPDLPAAPSPRTNLGNIVNDVDPDLVEQVSQRQIDALDRVIAAQRRAREEQQRFADDVRRFSGPATAWNAQLDLMHFKLNQQADALLLADQRAIGYLGTLEEFTRVQIPEFPSRSIGTGIGLPPVSIPPQTFDPAIDKVEVLQKNLRLVDSILSGINAKWAQMATVAVRAIDGVVTNLMEGDWLGAITAGVSGLIGLISGANRTIDTVINPARDKWFNAAGGLEQLNAQMLALEGHVGSVKAVFDADTVEAFEAATAHVNETLERHRALITETFGAYEDVREKMRGIVYLSPNLEAALDAAMNADTAKDMRDALRDVNSELDKQKGKYNDIAGLLAKYKIPEFEVQDEAFRSQFIGGQAADFRKEFDIVKAAGIDLNVFWRAAGENLRKFITDAQKMGVELPLAMQEVIQTAIDAGEVYDENGGKITDITELGLTFGGTMETVVGRIETVFDRLLLVLEGMARFFKVTLPGAAEDGASGIQDALDSIDVPDLTVPVTYDYPDPADYHTETQGFTYGEGRPGDVGGAFRGGLVTARGVQHFAQGGKVLPFVPRGIDTVPAMLAVGEGVVNRTGMGVLGEDGLRGLNSGRGSRDSGSVVINFHEGAFQAGALIHQDDVEDFMSSATLKAIEKGGRKFGRFSKLVRQAS